MEITHQGELLNALIYRDKRTLKEISKITGIPQNTIISLYKKDIIPLKYSILLSENGIDLMAELKIRKISSLSIQHKDTHSGAKKRGDLLQKESSLIPYYNGDVLAGKIDIVREGEAEYVKDYYSIPSIKADAIISVYGDSMYPTFKRGDKILIKQVNDFEIIEYTQTYVIITKDNTVLKMIRRSKKTGYWLLCSENEKYDTYEIPIGKVVKLYLVKGVMRGENLG